ncbi:MAG: type I-C CRISPR-associated protein Cas7/Csd2 [Pirellula sp.]|jgi:CRISPR-associated protein Csd2|nr:type I-C CRISPR-associated protein Cas7/Csd2 [Pirellula sp.]
MNRYDFAFFFDVLDGNPNGDPDAGNLPRVDSETGQGLVTDVCLKRKIRNYVGLAKGEQPPFEIYVKERAILNLQHERAWQAIDPKATAKDKEQTKDQQKAAQLTKWMCTNFYDIRAFGAVMTTKVNCGQVRGPVQLSFARSVEPIVTLEHAITRCAVATEKESEAQEGGNRTMGRKFTVPYALYRCHGYINPKLAEQTGFSDEDLNLLWRALEYLFDADRSASRGQMTARKLFVFKHEDALGNAPAHKLLDRIKLNPRNSDQPARSFEDYSDLFAIDRNDMPHGVELQETF